MDKVRVLRIVEYEGDREWVEKTVKNSIHGEKMVGTDRKIRVATIGVYPEIMDDLIEKETEKEEKSV